MNAALPTGWPGRILALLLGLVVLTAAYTAIAVPLLQLYADRTATIETRRTLLLKMQAVAAELPQFEARVAALRAGGDDKKVTLDGASDAIASAALQGRIESFASGAGVTIGSTESLPAAARGPYRRVGLRLVLNGSYDGIVKLLGRLETAAPPVIVDNLQIHSFQRRPGATPVTALDASIEVYGFRADSKTADLAKP